MTEEKKELLEPPEEDIAELEALLKDEKRKSVEATTKLGYLQADFENYRKRMEKELREVEDFAVGDLVIKLLSPMDELRLAIEGAESRKGEGPLLDGIRMVYKKLSAVLEKEGLSPISAVGSRFDPDLHEAVEKVEGEEGQQEDVVVEEVRRGYTFRNQVIRPSLVKVKMAAKKEAKEEVTSDE